MEKWKSRTILKFPASVDLVGKNIITNQSSEGKRHQGREEGDIKETTALKCRWDSQVEIFNQLLEINLSAVLLLFLFHRGYFFTPKEQKTNFTTSPAGLLSSLSSHNEVGASPSDG